MQASTREQIASKDRAETDAATEAADTSPTDAATADTARRLATDLGALMKHLLVSTGRDFFTELERCGISLTQVKILGLLAEAEEPSAVGRLSDVIGLSVPGVSRAADGLVQRGELTRAEDPNDRRSKLLAITPKGRRTYDRLIAVRLAGVRKFVEELEPGEREGLAKGLEAIAGRLTR